uniref:Deoxyribonuclease-1 n=1 Tax=Falco tinnunculus TaxID=100819 RepID=A0A8C4XRZ5_FALTI
MAQGRECLLTGAGGHREPPLTLSPSHFQHIPAPIQLFGQHPPGSDQLQGAVPLHLQVRDATRVQQPPCHPLSSPATAKGPWVPLGALAAAGAVPAAALLPSLRSDMVSVLGSYYYDDGCEPCGTDTFSREPFIVKFSSPTTRVEEFVIVPLHAKPSHAPEEIDALYEVYTNVVNKWATNNILLLGDFNADCSYVTSAEWPSIRLRSLDACEWLIPDSADTTVADTTDCAYDRIVACGTALRQDIEPGSATVNNFQKTFHLQRKDALAVSDHFPVEVILKAR